MGICRHHFDRNTVEYGIPKIRPFSGGHQLHFLKSDLIAMMNNSDQTSYKDPRLRSYLNAETDEFDRAI